MSLVQQFFRSRQIILEQLATVDYDIEPHMISLVEEMTVVYTLYENGTKTDKKEKKENMANFIVYGKEEQDKRRVFICYIDKLSPKIIDEYAEKINNKKLDTILFILQDDPSDAIIDHLINLYNYNQTFIVFQTIRRTQYNILNHELVPQDIFLLADEELPTTTIQETDSTPPTFNILKSNMHDIKSVPELLKKFKITIDKLPEESRFSQIMISKLIRPGQVLCYYRYSPTALISPHWVKCVNGI